MFKANSRITDVKIRRVRCIFGGPTPLSPPRSRWLFDFLHEDTDRKVLVITALASAAVALDRHLKVRAGVRSAAFHEGLTLIERDRAAAYFADDDPGAQVLVCSEIGSEGRNFQSAHHLVLLDLPDQPDLVEQRIGRLDRIGQRHDIEIHVPVIAGSRQELLARWYHEGADLLEHPSAGGTSLYEAFADQLSRCADEGDSAAFEQLLRDTRAFAGGLRENLRRGRDRLLELNSCNPEKAAQTIEVIVREEAAGELASYMELAFDRYGGEHEFHSARTLIIRPGEHMRTGHFPGLADDASTVTFDRQKALAREDIEFLSWEHPMVIDTMDMITSSEIGNATLGRISLNALPPGTLLLEATLVVGTTAPARLQLGRYLRPIPVRVLIDGDEKDWTIQLPRAQLDALCEPVDRATAQAIVKQTQDKLEQMTRRRISLAEERLPMLIAQGRARCREALSEELESLTELSRINPAIRADEIEALEHQLATSDTFIAGAVLRLEALRLVINVPG